MADRDLELMTHALASVQRVRSGIDSVFRLLAQGDCDSLASDPASSASASLHSASAAQSSTSTAASSSINGTLPAASDPDPEESRRRRYVVQLKEALNTVTRRVYELDETVASVHLPAAALQLANTGLLSQDPTGDVQWRCYARLAADYRWLERTRELAAGAAALCASHGTLKRSQHVLIKRRNRHATHTGLSTVTAASPAAAAASAAAAAHHVDAILQTIARSFVDLRLSVIRPGSGGAGGGGASSAVVLVCVDRVLLATMAMRGLVVEWTQVRAIHEPSSSAAAAAAALPQPPPGGSTGDTDSAATVDLWTRSEYEVFRRVSDNACAALLHYYHGAGSHVHVEYSVRSYLSWLRSYGSLFTAVCARCGCRLRDALPPTWRDFKTMLPYHDECRA